MIMLPILSLGILIICLLGALVSFQYFTHYQGLMMFDREHIAEQRRRSQSALGYLVAFGFGAVVALGGLVYPSIAGAAPEAAPLILEDGTLPEDMAATLPAGEAPANPPAEIPSTQPIEPTAVPTPAQLLPRATIANTGGAGANIRSAPGLGGAVIAVLPDGTRVILLEERQEIDGFAWQAIEMQDTQQGWVVTQYLIPDN